MKFNYKSLLISDTYRSAQRKASLTGNIAGESGSPTGYVGPGGGLSAAEMLHQLGNQRAGRFDKRHIDKFIRLMRLIDGAGAEHQRWA